VRSIFDSLGAPLSANNTRCQCAAAAADSSGGESLEQFDGDREDDGRVLFGGDLRQSLEVAQLERRRRLVDDVGGLLERARCLLLTLRRDHLQCISLSKLEAIQRWSAICRV